MSKHTPGPWEWNEDNQLVSATESYPLQSYEDESDRKPVLIVETDSGFYPPRGPDRLLLAAAPELLSSLIEMLAEAEGWLDDARGCKPDGLMEHGAFDRAYAIIAKATGGAA